MSPVDAAMVERKLERIAANLALLEPFVGMDASAYRSRVMERKGAEKLLCEVVEAAVDINAHLLVESGQPAPPDYFESFVRAGHAGIIDSALAQELAPSAGLRNRLVHQYDEIDDAKVLQAFALMDRLYPRYVKAVRGFLSAASQIP